MTDLEPTIAAKSDQMNADDLLAGPRVYIVERVSANEGGDAAQPINIYLKDSKVPWRPSKTMRRVLVFLWGSDGDKYAGRSLKLWRDPDVVFGGIKVGGIRILAMSHISSAAQLMLASRRGQKAPVKIEVLGEPLSEDTGQLLDAERMDHLAALLERKGLEEAPLLAWAGNIPTLSAMTPAQADKAIKNMEARPDA